MNQAQQKPMQKLEPEAEEPTMHDDKTPPSWFARTYGNASAREMAEQYLSNRPLPEHNQPLVAENTAAYEAYRKRLEERFSTARQHVDPHFMPQDNHPREASFPTRPTYAHGNMGRNFTGNAPKKTRGLKPVTLALLAVAACGLGGSLGYLGANPDRATQAFSGGVAFFSGLWPTSPAPVRETVITKKTVMTAKLEVNNLEGAVNAPIPLDITALNDDEKVPIALRISGLPPAAYLTKGVEVSEGEWMLKAADIAQAELVVPHTDTSALALQVYALEESTGEPTSPIQNMTVKLDTAAVPVPGVPQPKTAPKDAVVIPATAVADQGFNKTELPPAVPLPLETLDPEVKGFISKGERLLADGDILAARQFFLRAYELKAPTAAYGVGQTFDPAVYAKHNIKGLTPNPQKAAEWYGKAAAAGSEQASAALAELPPQP